LNDTDAACGVVTLAVFMNVRIGVTQTKQRKTTQLTPKSYERHRAEEAILVPNLLLLEGPLLDE
jgi:uncharacterized protein YcgI (DUF1989 family)